MSAEDEAERAGLGLVDVDVELRRVVEAVGAHAGEQRVLGGQAEQLVARGHQAVVAEAAAVLQLEVEAGGVAELLHRRRHEREDLRVADLREAPHGALRRSPARGSRRPGARFQSFRWMKAMAGVLARRRRS